MACGGSNEVPETPEEIELARIAMERWSDYKTRFIPVENLAIQDVMKDVNEPSEFGPSMANLSAQMEFSRMEPQLTQGLTLRGARPGSGAFSGGLMNMNLDRTASSGLGQVNAMGLQRTQNIQNLGSLISMGQGQSTEALSGMGDIAAQAQRQAILDAQASAAARAAIGQAVGTGAGMWYGNMSNRSLDSKYNVTGLDTSQAQWKAGTGN